MKWINKIAFLEKIIVSLLIFTLVFSSAFNFISRNFLSNETAVSLSDIFSSIIPHLVLITGFIGASIGIGKGEVIKIDILKNKFNKKLERLFVFIAFFITSILLLFYIYFSWKSRELGDAYWIIFGYIPSFILIMVKSLLVALNKENLHEKI